VDEGEIKMHITLRIAAGVLVLCFAITIPMILILDDGWGKFVFAISAAILGCRFAIYAIKGNKPASQNHSVEDSKNKESEAE
jgi:hypothetical protein